MAPFFGEKDDGHEAVDTMTADIERIDALQLQQLAAEVMTKGFGPDGPAGAGRPGTFEGRPSGICPPEAKP